MDALSYLFSVAVSGSDAPRLMWLILFGALLCGPRFTPGKMALVALTVDRVWPFVAMGFSGYGPSDISAALAHSMLSIPLDSVPILLRGLILYLGIFIGFSLRMRVHGKRVGLTTGKAKG